MIKSSVWTLAVLVLAAALSVACGSSRSEPGTGDPPPPADPPPPIGGDDPDTSRHRYAFANQCWVLKSVSADRYLRKDGSSYAADAEAPTDSERFFLKPSALGEYLLFDREGSVVRAGTPATARDLAGADDASRFRLRVTGDATEYPDVPQIHVEPTPDIVNALRAFQDPLVEGTEFTFTEFGDDRRLSIGDGGVLTMADAGDDEAQQFRIESAQDCGAFPEANDNTAGDTFKGTTEDGRVLGMADVHVHVSATDFLGGAQWGHPFHPLGVLHALGDCAESHGENGERDAVGGLLGGQFSGHATDGWPTFTDWPARNMLTHEAIYWKWLERAWKAGLRIAVNDVVDNETLCKLQRNITATPLTDCNEMNNAGRQVGTMYAMQDYIDAQYGGPGRGWFRIVHDPVEARGVVEAGKLAVVLGIEISNLLNCKVTYNPLRLQEPFEETGTGVNENRYSCRMTEEGADDEVLTQIQRLWDIGIRQVITIHEFDNAFGGNGIFEGLVLNLGNRENTGGIPDLGGLEGALAMEDGLSPLGNIPITEAGTGEFWTTYDCPTVDDPRVGGGFYSDARAGTVMSSLPPGCLFVGQGGRPGGTTACYPSTPQCNARWMTPIGLYTFGKLMEFGWVIDVDHLEFEMKNQLLELVEAQSLPYPLVSTHGTFGGMSNAQAMRVLQAGGFVYPSLGNGPRHLDRLDELKVLWEQAGRPFEFGFGFGTDTNGLSAQPPPRGTIEPGKEIVYPFNMFQGPLFQALPEFIDAPQVTFFQPEERDAQARGRTWHQDQVGNAHYGMLSDTVQEVQIEGTAEQLRDLYNSAEVYLQMWERTFASSQAIRLQGLAVPDGILRPAPLPSTPIKVD